MEPHGLVATQLIVGKVVKYMNFEPKKKKKRTYGDKIKFLKSPLEAPIKHG